MPDLHQVLKFWNKFHRRKQRSYKKSRTRQLPTPGRKRLPRRLRELTRAS
jgi:hypothetical protein